jgi:hypothetical protein
MRTIQPTLSIIFNTSLLRRIHADYFSGVIYATGTLSIRGDGFQSGYRWLSVRGNGPEVAQALCKKLEKSPGLAANLLSSSETGM